MSHRSFSLVPLMRTCTGAATKPFRVHARNFWDLVRVPDARSVIRDMNREMERMERNMFRNFPLSFSVPRLIAIEDDISANKAFQMDIDVKGFKPEDIKITLKNRVMKVEGKMDRSSEDGKTRLQQTFVREFSIPENVDPSSLKSFIDNNGVLYIEAPLAKEDEPKNIPIQLEAEAQANK